MRSKLWSFIFEQFQINFYVFGIGNSGVKLPFFFLSWNMNNFSMQYSEESSKFSNFFQKNFIHPLIFDQYLYYIILYLQYLLYYTIFTIFTILYYVYNIYINFHLLSKLLQDTFREYVTDIEGSPESRAGTHALFFKALSLCSCFAFREEDWAWRTVAAEANGDSISTVMVAQGKNK